MMFNVEWMPWIMTASAFGLVLMHGWLQGRRIKALEARLRDCTESLGRDLHALNSGSIGMGRRLVACERDVQALRTSLEELRHNDPVRIAYDEASRLVELGAGVEDLMSTCGISRPEAELVSALNSQRRSRLRAVVN